jgi:nitrogenase molybdenum-cofactor synthesis protein NifE
MGWKMSTTLAEKAQEVFNEPGCDVNQGKSAKERNKGCTKQLVLGAAAGLPVHRVQR